MKYYSLTKEEKELLESYDQDDFQVVKEKDVKKKYKEYADNSLSKTRNINIRLSERDIRKLKEKAAHKGLPYQTMIASVLHQYGEN